MKEIILERKLDVMFDNIINSLEKHEYQKAYNLLHFYKKNAKITDYSFVDFMLINASINIKKYDEAQKLINQFKKENKNQELLDFVNNVEKELKKYNNENKEFDKENEINRIKSMLTIIQKIKNVENIEEISKYFSNMDNFKIIKENEDFEIANIILNLSYFRLKNMCYLMEVNKKSNELIKIIISDPINLILLNNEELKKIIKNDNINFKNKILILSNYFLLKRILLNKKDMEIIKKNQEIYNELIIISNEENYIKNYDLVYQIIYMCLDLSIKKEDIITICQYFLDRKSVV